MAHPSFAAKKKTNTAAEYMQALWPAASQHTWPFSDLKKMSPAVRAIVSTLKEANERTQMAVTEYHFKGSLPSDEGIHPALLETTLQARLRPLKHKLSEVPSLLLRETQKRSLHLNTKQALTRAAIMWSSRTNPNGWKGIPKNDLALGLKQFRIDGDKFNQLIKSVVTGRIIPGDPEWSYGALSDDLGLDWTMGSEKNRNGWKAATTFRPLAPNKEKAPPPYEPAYRSVSYERPRSPQRAGWSTTDFSSREMSFSDQFRLMVPELGMKGHQFSNPQDNLRYLNVVGEAVGDRNGGNVQQQLRQHLVLIKENYADGGITNEEFARVLDRLDQVKALAHQGHRNIRFE
ncbi:MAG: hypothetical protein K1X64_06655 [Myxococcaceae bacterium]|nr:hypothetical protein [Myxococcaceae bacterium]